jgi:NAD+ synthetase
VAAARRLREPLVRRLAPTTEADPVAITAGMPVASGVPSEMAPIAGPEHELWGALVQGVRDYVGKNGFPGVIIGLSGGIDSALTAAIAVDALGPDRVRGVAMPSVFTESRSTDDAQTLATSLGIRMDVIEIAPVVDAFEAQLAHAFEGRPRDVAEENLQARIRGVLIMALSNKWGWLVLTTGNKSEMSVGYCTLYGDMAGGYAVLKDVPKTLVYELTKLKNKKEKIRNRETWKLPSGNPNSRIWHSPGIPSQRSLNATDCLASCAKSSCAVGNISSGSAGNNRGIVGSFRAKAIYRSLSNTNK